MEKVILILLKLANQFRIFHWQTKSYARHKAFGNAYDTLSDLIDSLVEVHQGKYGVIVYPSPASLELKNTNELDVDSILEEVTNYLSTEFTEMHDASKDTDCLNIRDEILSSLNRLKYLLTLE